MRSQLRNGFLQKSPDSTVWVTTFFGFPKGGFLVRCIDEQRYIGVVYTSTFQVSISDRNQLHFRKKARDEAAAKEEASFFIQLLGDL